MKRILAMLLVILVALILIQCKSDSDLYRGEDAFKVFSDYGLRELISIDWTNHSIELKTNNEDSPNHDFYKVLDPNYKHLQVINDLNPEKETLSFVIFDSTQWNDNADKATGGDIDLLPEILYFNHKDVISVDPNDYDNNKEAYNEVIDQLMIFNFYERYLDDYKTNDLITIETDYIIYDSNLEDIQIAWRSIIGDPIRTTGNYYIEHESHGKWQEVYTGKVASEEIYDIESSSYPCSGLEEGHYRLAVEYERLNLYGLELNEKELYRVYGTFDVGSQAVKRHENMGLDGISLVTEHETYPEDTLAIKCRWINELNDEFTYGQMFALEKYTGGEWVNVDFGDIAFTSEGYMLEPNSEVWFTYDMTWILKSLEKGKYRIKTDIIRDTLDGVDFGAGNYPIYDIYAPFEVVEK